MCNSMTIMFILLRCDTIRLQYSVEMFKAAVHVCVIRANTQKV